VSTTRPAAAPASGYRAGPHPSPWEGPLAALDILLNNLGVGLFLVAAIGVLAAHDEFEELAGITIPVAFAIIALDLLLLVVDLGDPFRFFHMLRVIKPRTPMSVGVWSLSLLMITLVPIVVISVVGWFTEVPSGLDTLATVLTAVAIVPAFGGLAYKGVLFSVTAQPGWRDARWLGAHVCSSGVALGSSLALFIAVLADSTDAVKPLQAATLTLIAVSTVALLLLYRDLRPELRLRSTPARRTWFYTGVVLFGVVAPVTLLFLGAGTANCAVAVTLLLAAEYAVRFAFVSVPRAAVEH
jgi:formate-dependent nitrite reductase membrane component NrfD